MKRTKSGLDSAWTGRNLPSRDESIDFDYDEGDRKVIVVGLGLIILIVVVVLVVYFIRNGGYFNG